MGPFPHSRLIMERMFFSLLLLLSVPVFAYEPFMKRTFDERGIEIPFPHRTVYMGETKEGTAPPLHVNMQGSPADLKTG